jgi:hypothetical protein
MCQSLNQPGHLQDNSIVWALSETNLTFGNWVFLLLLKLPNSSTNNSQVQCVRSRCGCRARG